MSWEHLLDTTPATALGRPDAARVAEAESAHLRGMLELENVHGAVNVGYQGSPGRVVAGPARRLARLSESMPADRPGGRR